VVPFTGCNNSSQEDNDMKSMKTILAATMAALLLFGASARAGIFTDNANTAIPVGDPIGLSTTISVSGLQTYTAGVTLSLDISGGNNGDLYGYLSYDGVIVTLINRPGVSGSDPLGYAGSGFNITLSDGSYPNINTTSETAGSQVTGTYNPSGSVAFASLDGLNPNGTWTLFLANESSGGGSSTLVSWDLAINAVPEPTNVALAVFGVLAVAGRVWAGWKKSRASSKSGLELNPQTEVNLLSKTDGDHCAGNRIRRNATTDCTEFTDGITILSHS
jgi:hypothetical protein